MANSQLETLIGEKILCLVPIKRAKSTLQVAKERIQLSSLFFQNGNAFQPVEVVLGRTSGDFVEVDNGLFAGDAIATQRATQLYVQSLRIYLRMYLYLV